MRDADASLAARRLEPAGRLAVTAPVLFGRRYVVPIVTEFLGRHPAVERRGALLDRAVGLVEEGLDAGVRIGKLADSSLVAVPVGELRRVVCASPAYLRKHGAPKAPEDLREHACVRFAALDAGRRVALRDGTANGGRGRDGALRDQPGRRCAARVRRWAWESACSCRTRSRRRVSERRLRYVLTEFEREPVPVQVIYPHRAAAFEHRTCVRRFRRAAAARHALRLTR